MLLLHFIFQSVFFCVCHRDAGCSAQYAASEEVQRDSWKPYQVLSVSVRGMICPSS